ncbi:hypothetical protein ABKN59_002808 [Abortiporus biennis]
MQEATLTRHLLLILFAKTSYRSHQWVFCRRVYRVLHTRPALVCSANPSPLLPSCRLWYCRLRPMQLLVNTS